MIFSASTSFSIKILSQTARLKTNIPLRRGNPTANACHPHLRNTHGLWRHSTISPTKRTKLHQLYSIASHVLQSCFVFISRPCHAPYRTELFLWILAVDCNFVVLHPSLSELADESLWSGWIIPAKALQIAPRAVPRRVNSHSQHQPLDVTSILLVIILLSTALYHPVWAKSLCAPLAWQNCFIAERANLGENNSQEPD